MKHGARIGVTVIVGGMLFCGSSYGGNGGAGDTASTGPVSFKENVMPVIKKYCLPCHAEDNYNPSELSLDSYDLLMTGGKHGKPVVEGKSGERILIKKLHPDPPFGKPMPLKRRLQPEQQWVPDDLIKVIADWIDQGAKNN